MLIILDNGHGKNTEGKRSPIWSDNTQLYEYEFNRDIVKRISDKLNSLCVDNLILVPELDDISLSERCRRVNKLCESQPCVLISIHANAGKGTGWECWTSKGNTKSDVYADILYESAIKYFKGWRIRMDMSDGDKDWESNFTVLQNTKCPAILTENFFMDNYKDCKYLLSDEGRENIANMHVEGILNIINYEMVS